jgi:hypothetical protein
LGLQTPLLSLFSSVSSFSQRDTWSSSLSSVRFAPWLREANRAVELEGDDTYVAPAADEALAIIEAQTGETASAVARLPRLLNAHYFSWLSFAPLTPALLRIDPLWDPLRDDPLFQKLTKEGQL